MLNYQPTMFEALEHIPSPSPKRIAVRISRKAEVKILQGHPWLYANSVRELSSDGNPGDLAVIFDHNRNFIAIGLYDPLSPFLVRILQHRSPTPINKDFFLDRFKSAAKVRASLHPNTTGYRMVHGENDGFPGLVIDKYHRNLVVKLYSVSWIPHLNEILTILKETVPFDSIILRLNRGIQKHLDFLHGLRDGQFLFGSMENPTFLFQENNLWFEANPILGHKTGFYFDQRENRQRVEKYANGKTLLNLFAYSGGFSVYAGRGGANKVISVDSSQPALAAAERNFQRNKNHINVRNCNHAIISGDAFQVLENFGIQNQTFDMIIIDPPSFAKNKNESTKAISAYQRLTKLATKVLIPDGILVQASCSTRISPKAFFDAIHQAANEAGRPLYDITHTGHPTDHPIRFKEGVYLKCIFARC